MLINDEPAVFNHIIGTLYVEQKDKIGAHSDKMKDIRAGSDIISLSVGDVREFVLTSKDGDGVEQQSLEDGDLFERGPATNARLVHAVVPVKDERITERNGAPAGPRISIVLRASRHSSLELKSWPRLHTLIGAKSVLVRLRCMLSQRPHLADS
jgi:2OG-Fe(II) oxygenase superfamily